MSLHDLSMLELMQRRQDIDDMIFLRHLEFRAKYLSPPEYDEVMHD